MNRSDLQKLTQERLDEANLLFVATKYNGAYYLAGYAVEFALKACIAKQTNQHDFYNKVLAGQCFSHKPVELVRAAGIRPQLDADMKADIDLQTNWSVVCTWTEASRYEWNGKAEAEALLMAITDPVHGVLQWIKMHW